MVLFPQPAGKPNADESFRTSEHLIILEVSSFLAIKQGFVHDSKKSAERPKKLVIQN